MQIQYDNVIKVKQVTEVEIGKELEYFQKSE